MRVLSFSRPWLWAVLHPDPAIKKTTENRTWAPPVSQIGKRFALHSAKSWDEDALRYWLEIGIKEFPMRKDLYPSGAVLGVATIDRIRTFVDPGELDVSDPTGRRFIRPPTYPTDLPESQRRWFFGPFGWILTDVIALDTPIPLKGGQGLRELPADVEAEIDRQLADIARRPIVRYLTPEESDTRVSELHRLARQAGKI